MSLRRGAFPIDEQGSRLSPRLRELLMLAIEVSALMSPPPTYHAIKAIDAGATPEEIAEVVALCVVLRGMISYQQSGRYALEAAHERATQAATGRPQRGYDSTRSPRHLRGQFLRLPSADPASPFDARVEAAALTPLARPPPCMRDAYMASPAADSRSKIAPNWR